MNLANRITLARIGLIPLFLLFYQTYPDWMVAEAPMLRFANEHGAEVAVLLFVLASATDKLDGYVARKYNQITNLGKLLDPLADKLLISAALIMLVQHHLIPSWMAVIIIGREIIVTGLRIVASAQGIALAADRYGKWKLVLQVAAVVIVMVNSRMPLPSQLHGLIDYGVMAAAVGMTVYSGFNYFRSNLDRLHLDTC
ncbi:CDP-diacylglycerol--glycerol-3-phosphate 3-phosphatidyltransferase [Paenibacillus dendritiformis]|uniref:CDP-diacylglycerol--glycerol-3-phosphate 3-phosphatidyltransferase n=1 Tax=Paenibacillus dendritiformis C454 TaxID=1131935 RepID=H3SBX8_9BACL|nr:CDP-diacylglycerol--glycerol-3-phosphate 3-phosphatidyltransferase [Paenibacillus dendritiformis]EHQ63492.1 CDP-diacylglycerol/glycerol-3-phosphate 3-phosphatidyltransferase [Paenibacillus dendritiformis C454]CAH8771253.1 CDP-diacylglycerol--glycerol-3-phosphate 3-phosphatidyltransferase [Paenibacillus dendritiformis]